MPLFLRTVLLVLFLAPFSSWAVDPLAESIDALVERFDNSACRGCHAEIHAQWEESWHSRSLVSAAGISRTFLRTGLEDQWRTEFSKDHLMKCLHCHAPTVRYASDELARSIADLLITAGGDGGDAADAAREQLSRLSVGCWSCHNLAATTYLTNTRGEPESGAIYGPSADVDAPHKTIAAVQLKRSLFCSQCHGVWTAPDGERMTCATLPGSYYHNYKARGGARTCQDCHMGAGKGHRMPGGHVIEMVWEGLGLGLEVDHYLHMPEALEGHGGGDMPVPTAVVTAYVENRAGHRVPDG